jgi:hypothetical protein
MLSIGLWIRNVVKRADCLDFGQSVQNKGPKTMLLTKSGP